MEGICVSCGSAVMPEAMAWFWICRCGTETKTLSHFQWRWSSKHVVELNKAWTLPTTNDQCSSACVYFVSFLLAWADSPSRFGVVGKCWLLQLHLGHDLDRCLHGGCFGYALRVFFISLAISFPPVVLHLADALIQSSLDLSHLYN